MSAPAGADSALGKLLITHCKSYGLPAAALTQVPQGRTPEDLVRHLGFLVLAGHFNRYNAHQQLPRALKPLGIDATKIVNEVAPKPKPETGRPAKKAARRKVQTAGKPKAARKTARGARRS